MAVLITDLNTTMNKFFSSLFISINAFLVIGCILVVSCEFSLANSRTPKLNDGKKWRIAYYQGGPIPFYSYTQKEIIKELMKQGWVEEQSLPEHGLSEEPPYWNWLSNSASSKYLEFLPGNGYSASWNVEKRKKVSAELLTKLQSGEIDLVIAMGTWAGEDLVNDSHTTPTLVMAATAFEQTGIIKSIDDSGFDHVSVHLDPSFFERQLRMYHRVVGFQKLGVAYENTEEGLRYSTIGDIKRVATERGFEVNLCEVLDTTDDRVKSRESCLSCFKELTANSDAIYITSLLCAEEEIDALADLFKAGKVASYSAFGSKHVEKGILLGASALAGYEVFGAHNGNKIIQVLSGIRPGYLSQVVELPLFVSINTATAKAIDFKVPKSIHKIARETYDK